MATYTARIPTVEYGYIEVVSDNYNDFVEAATNAQDSVETVFGKAVPTPVAPNISHDQAVQNLQDGGLVGQPEPPVQQQATDRWGNPIIGIDPVSGEQVLYRSEGKYGPCVSAGKVYGPLKDWDKNKIPTLDQAVNSLNWKRKKMAGEA